MLFATWHEGLAPLPADAALSAGDIDGLPALREQVAKVLEPMRAAGEIGAALEAEIELRCGVADLNRLEPLADELRFLFISGDVGGAGRRRARDRGVGAADRQGQVRALLAPPRGRRRASGAPAVLCGRCVSNIEGPGETRTYF